MWRADAPFPLQLGEDSCFFDFVLEVKKSLSLNKTPMTKETLLFISPKIEGSGSTVVAPTTSS
jgi:hypothetical protein